MCHLRRVCFIYESRFKQAHRGPSPSQDRVLFLSLEKKHKPPEPVVVGSKPTGPASPIIWKYNLVLR